MKRQLILLTGFCLLALNVSLAQDDYVKQGNDCFDKGDYKCAKDRYSAQKINGDETGMDEKIEQCDKCLDILLIANYLFSDKKDFKEAKSKYEELLRINPQDPFAKSRIISCNNAISAAMTRPADTDRTSQQTQTQTQQTPVNQPPPATTTPANTNTLTERKNTQTNALSSYPTIDKHPNINISGLYNKGEKQRKLGVNLMSWGLLVFTLSEVAILLSDDVGVGIGVAIGGAVCSLSGIPIWASGKKKTKQATLLYDQDKRNVSELKVGFTNNGIGLAFTF